MTSGFTDSGLDSLRRDLENATVDAAPGLAWLVARGDDVHRGTAGVSSIETGRQVQDDSLFRIASLTKPVTAVATLVAMERGVLALTDPIDRWLPELADRVVLRNQSGPLDDTVPAVRAIEVRDLLTFTAGYGYDFANIESQAQVGELARLELGVGPPAPATVPDVDEWMKRLSTVPLDHQPGEAWRYHFAAEILGVLLARALDEPFGDLLRHLVFDPLGMVDTSFHVENDRRNRLTTAYDTDPETGKRRVYDEPSGQWAAPPAFPSGGGGLVSTVDDFCAFARMLAAGGMGPEGRLISEESVHAMTTDHLVPAAVSVDDEGKLGWGFCVDVQREPGDGPRPVGSYGWAGGLGTAWMNDPTTGLIGVLFTNQALGAPDQTPVMDIFWNAAYDALA